MPPIKKFLSCNNIEEVKHISKSGKKQREREPFETLENIEVAEIDDYLNAVLSKCRRS